MKPKIVIDCDPGADDAVAILCAARHLDLVGVTTVHGNSTVEHTTRNALAILELAGLDVPVVAGCGEPLRAGRPPRARDALEGAALPAPRRRPVDGHAVDFLIETAHRHRGELVVAAIAPQTNLARALRREPRLKDWLREISIMGGSTGLGNVTAAAELNIHCDPEAAAEVLHSGAAIRMVGLNVTRATAFTVDDLARLRASGRTVAGVIADLLTAYLARQRARRGEDVAPMHDACAIVPYAVDGLIEYVPTRVEIELAGTHTRGMTVCDLRPRGPATAGHGPPANARVAIAAHHRALIEHVLATVLSYG